MPSLKTRGSLAFFPVFCKISPSKSALVQKLSDSFAVPVRRITAMSFMVWKIMRLLPKPVLLLLLFFLLAARA
jgi:hypothetical protein